MFCKCEAVNRFWIVPVTMAELVRIEAADDYVMIYAGSRKHLIGMALSKMECRLPKPPFLRVHRSHIVDLDHVDRVIAPDDSRMEVRMKDGAVVPVGRARSQDIRQLATR
jgi:two-component system LytT family response regulator